MMTDRSHNVVHVLLGSLWGMSVIGVLAYFLWPFDPVTYLSNSDQCSRRVTECSIVLDEDNTLHPGETIKVLVDVRHKTSGVPVTVHTELQGREIHHYGPFNYVTDGSFSNFVNTSFSVPKQILPGTYVLQFSSCFEMHIFRTVCLTRETETFVVEPELPPDGTEVY